MGFIDRLLRRENPNITVTFAQNVVNTIMGMDPSDLYETQDSLRAVVDFISTSIASCPLKVYTREDDNDRRRDTESDWALLLAEPNSHQTTYDFVNAAVHEICLYDECLIVVTQDPDSSSGWQMEVIPNTWITNRKSNGFYDTKWYVQNPYSHEAGDWVERKDVIYIGGYNSGQPGAVMSPVAPLKNILREQISAWTFRNQVWERGGRMTAYITRPADAGEWTPEQRDRFIKSWRERYAGNKAPDAGSMPLFEDGMEIKSTQFNARETQWSEALTLSRESTAAVYHINPAMVWSGDGQTYASVKENSRSLYVDCLGPKLEMLAQALNRFLLPKVGAPKNAYCEFDIRIKLSGSFEEQSDVMVRATGTAYQTINETRALMNLPRLDDPDADKIVKPLNVVFGGQASPLTPTEDPGSKSDDMARMIAEAIVSAQATAQKSQETATSSNVSPLNDEAGTDTPETKELPSELARTVYVKGAPSTDDVMVLSGVFRKFYKRQRKSVLNQIDRARDKGTLHQVKEAATATEPALDVDESLLREWYDLDRWDRELCEDLIAQLNKIGFENITQILEEIYADPGAYSEEYVRAYIEDYAEKLSHQVNVKTLEELVRAVDDADSFSASDALKSTPAGVFDFAEDTRADNDGKSVATQIRGWSSIAAVHLSGKQETTYKIWRVRSANPRPSHAKMDGETIPYMNPKWCRDPLDSDHFMKPGFGEHSHFSNGCRFPGDFNRSVKEVAGCQCEMDIEVRF